MELMKAIDKRRSYRAFDPVEIDDEMVRDLAHAASRAPSCNNFQPWRFIFVRDSNTLERLKGTLAKGNYWAERASMIIAVISKPGLDCQIEGRDYNMLDTGMALGLLLLRAVDIDLATHPIAGFDHIRAKEILNIPMEYQLLPLVIVGKRSDDMTLIKKDWQVKQETERSERKPLEEIMFLDTFKVLDR